MLVMEDYQGSISKAVEGDPSWRGLPYAACAERLFERGIFYGDAYVDAFAGRGVSAVQVVPDCTPLQRKWAAERRLWTPPKWAARAAFRWLWSRRFGATPEAWGRERILLDQVRFWRPRVLWFFSGTPLSSRLLRRCRELVDNLVLWWACPLSRDVPYREFDLVLSGIPDLVRYFQALGVNAAFVPHAFDRRVLDRISPSSPRIPKVGFVGSASLHHVERLLLLDLLARHVELDVYGADWDALPAVSPLAACYRGPAWGDRLHEVHGSYAVTVHHNIDVAGRSLSAKRLFEATGMGACVVVQHPPEDEDLFQPEREIVTYRSREEALVKVRYLLTHPEEAARIGAAAQQRTLRQHGYPNRVERIVELLEGLPRRTEGVGDERIPDSCGEGGFSQSSGRG